MENLALSDGDYMAIPNISGMDEDHIVDTLVEIEIDNSSKDDFLKIRETLTRMGVEHPEEKTLYQSCHILHKRQKYYIVHFKELFALDGKPVNMDNEDYARRNTITAMLQKWNMLKVKDPTQIESPILGGRSGLTIIPYGKKNDYKLVAKYEIG